MSSRTATKHTIPVDDTQTSSSAATCAEDSMQATETLTFTDTTTISVQASNDPAFTVVDQAPPRDSGELTKDSSWTPFERGDGYINADAEASGTALVSETAARPGAGPAISEPGDTPPESDMVPGGQEPADTIDKDGLAAGATDSSQHAIAESAPSAGGTEEARVDNTPYPGATADDAESLTQITEPVTPSAPDPSTISARLKNLVVSISQVEERSRRAREAAASDLALFNGIAASQHQFEEGLAEARHLSQEAQAVYHRAFGREARAVAEPAVAEAREVEQAFADLADAWRHQAESFLSEHPDVELLLAEQDEQHEEARRHEAARARAQCLQELVAATDAALRQGQLDDARACLKQLGRDFPTEAPRLAPLQERLDHRVRAANDAAARRTLLQAAEFQGRGGLELLCYSPSQGRGIILHRDPSVPDGLLVFSSLGMGSTYFEGRVVSNTEREGSAIVARARPFRAAEPLAELSAGWYGRSYTTTEAPSATLRH